MKSKIIKLDEFLLKEEWTIEQTNTCLTISPNLEQVCIFLLDNFQNKNNFLATIYVNKNGVILNKFNLLLGLYLFIKFSDKHFNLSKIYETTIKSKINDSKIKDLLEIIKDESAPITKNFHSVIQNFVINFETHLNGNSSDLINYFTNSLVINLVEVENLANIDTFTTNEMNFLEYRTIAELFKSKVLNLVSTKVSDSDVKKIHDMYDNKISKNIERIAVGQEWLSTLDTLITHIIQIEDLSLTKFHSVTKNYLIWMNVINVKISNFLNLLGYKAINSVDEFQDLLNKILQRSELLKIFATREKWDILSDVIRFMIVQFQSLKLPFVVLANLIIKNTEFKAQTLTYKKNDEDDSKILSLYKVMLKYLLASELTNLPPNIKIQILTTAIIDYNWSKSPIEMEGMLKEYILSATKNLEKEKYHFEHFADFANMDRISEILDSPIHINSPTMILLGSILSMHEILIYNHSLENISEWAPFIISQHIFPSHNLNGREMPVAKLGDILFLDKESANQVINSAKNRMPVNTSKLYFDACQKFNYLMKDATLQKVLTTNNWSNDSINERTEYYKKIILEFLN